MTPLIAIIVLNWNGLEDTIECLLSLQKLDYPHFKVIVVDNGSTDGSSEALKTRFPNIHLIELKSNTGFSHGNNRGIEYALQQGAEYILLLNNDTVVHPKMLKAFVAAAKTHPEAGAFGAKIFFYDEPTLIWHAGGDVHASSGRCFHLGVGDDELDKKHQQIRPINYACGCALFMRREAIEKVGLLCEDFFLLWEEIDWCWRLRQAGFACLFVPEAQLWHKVSHSFPEGNRGPTFQYHYWRNRLLFIQRHFPKKERRRLFRQIFFRELLDLTKQSFNFKASRFYRKQNRSAINGILNFILKTRLIKNKNNVN